MFTIVYIDTFADSWRAYQGGPIRAFQPCSASASGTCSRSAARWSAEAEPARDLGAAVVALAVPPAPDALPTLTAAPVEGVAPSS